MKLRTCDNYALLEAMAARIWRHHYPAIIGEAQTTYMLARNYNLNALAQQHAEGQQFYWICQDSGVEVGFMGISNPETNHLFIHKFYILPELQGQGIGKAAFKALLENYPETTGVELQVNRQNYKSINFYFSIGFKILRVADFDIGEGWQMNDFIMRWRRF